MKNKMLAWLLVLAMMMSVLPVMAMATNEEISQGVIAAPTVASEEGSTEPTEDETTTDEGVTTADGLAAAMTSGGTIKVTADITLESAIKVTNTVTLTADDDVTITTSATDLFDVGQGGTLTLGENITVESSVGAILYVHDGGTININGANLTAGENEENTLCYVEAGTVNMTAGSMASTKKVAIKTVNAGANVNISGGTVSSAGDNAIWATAGTVNISGTAKIADTGTNVNGEGYVTLWAQGGTINVSGGTVESKGGTLSVESNGTSSVTGGTFAGPVKANGGTLAISGGTFNTDVSSYLTNGFEVKDNGDGTYSVKENATEPEKIKVHSASVDMGNTLDMFFYIKKSAVTGENYTAKITMNGETKEIAFADWGTDETGYYYFVVFDGILAKQMTDEITVEIYSGDAKVSETWTDSIQAYVGRLLQKEGVSEDAKNAAKAMLRYGSAAQVYKNYKKENLADSILDATN